MIDPLEAATNLAKSKASGAASAAAAAATSAATNAASSAANAALGAASGVIANNPALSKLQKIPITKDPELLKQQAKAEAQKIIGEKQNELQQIKEKKIDEMKDKVGKLASLAAGAISLFIKLPVLDPKLIATIAFLKAQKELREAKQKMSKENLKKAKENFTYPMKPPSALSKIPAVPKIPKVKTAAERLAETNTESVDQIKQRVESMKTKVDDLKKQGADLESRGLKGSEEWKSVANAYIAYKSSVKLNEDLIRIKQANQYD